jgi:hypothetical protein
MVLHPQDILTAVIIVFSIIAIYYMMKYAIASNADYLFARKKVVTKSSQMNSKCGIPYHHENCGCYTRPEAKQYNITSSGKKIIVAPFSGPSFYSAHQNNTLEQRPGGYSTLLTYGDLEEQPVSIVKLIYQKGCSKHPFVAMFWHLKDMYEADETNPSSRVKFVAEIADPSDPYNWGASTSMYGPFPKIIKIRPNGQILEYQGHSNFGALADWIRDERILFNGPYY